MVKIDRSFPAPSSLAIESQKANGSYSEPDVIEQLSKDFFYKCYICEMDNLQDPEVEHLLPHKNGKYPDRKFDWNNLFWACGHCNKVKNQNKYDVGILDCCKEDPEKRIRFVHAQNSIVVEARKENDAVANLTATLVEEVFTLSSTGMRTYKSEMRFRELSAEMNVLYSNIEELKGSPDSRVVQRKLKAILRKESRFAAFKREYVRECCGDMPQLLSYIT